MSVMLGLAEYFSKIPQAQRRRTLKFVTTSGHHAGSLGTKWMSDNSDTFLAKTALMINCEHVSVTQTYPCGDRACASRTRPTRAAGGCTAATSWPSHLLERVPHVRRAVYHEMEPNASGDMGQVSSDAPSIS